jgi:hypothetical protein
MKKLRHDNIVQLYEVINDPDDYRLYIGMCHDRCVSARLSSQTYTHSLPDIVVPMHVTYSHGVR